MKERTLNLKAVVNSLPGVLFPNHIGRGWPLLFVDLKTQLALYELMTGYIDKEQRKRRLYKKNLAKEMADDAFNIDQVMETNWVKQCGRKTLRLELTMRLDAVS